MGQPAERACDAEDVQEQERYQTCTSNTLRLRGLPFAAGSEEVVAFFGDFKVVETYVCRRNGRSTGEAYVVLESQEAAEAALNNLNKGYMGTRYIELFEASTSDMESVKRMLEDASTKGHVVRLRGLPYSSTATDVLRFLGDLPVLNGADGVVFTFTADGRPTGECYAEFADESGPAGAMKLHRQLMGSRYIEVFTATRADLLQAAQHSRWHFGQAAMRMRWAAMHPGVAPMPGHAVMAPEGLAQLGMAAHAGVVAAPPMGLVPVYGMRPPHHFLAPAPPHGMAPPPPPSADAVAASLAGVSLGPQGGYAPGPPGTGPTPVRGPNHPPGQPHALQQQQRQQHPPDVAGHGDHAGGAANGGGRAGGATSHLQRKGSNGSRNGSSHGGGHARRGLHLQAAGGATHSSAGGSVGSHEEACPERSQNGGGGRPSKWPGSPAAPPAGDQQLHHAAAGASVVSGAYMIPQGGMWQPVGHMVPQMHPGMHWGYASGHHMYPHPPIMAAAPMAHAGYAPVTAHTSAGMPAFY